MLSLLQELETRWFINQYTSQDFFELYEWWGQVLYFGMDPTAESIHLGNLINFMSAVNFLLKWNKLIIVIGWATGMIGDPGGKENERSFIDPTTLQHNVDMITTQVETLLTNIEHISWQKIKSQVQIINNSIFYQDMSYIGFLRDIGKYITVNSMMTREAVKKRLTEAGKYISYTEFSYMLIQWYDFLKLYQDYKVRLQIAWSDQRWNITIWTELIRKIANTEVYGLTSPLILASNGKKFGKSEGNALRLDQNKTSALDMYNYFYNTQDDDVERYLKLFTLFSLDEIQNIILTHIQKPELRYGQKKLAEWILHILYDINTNTNISIITQYLKRDAQECKKCIDQLWNDKNSIIVDSSNLIDILIEIGLESSKWSAKKSILWWAISLNGNKVTDISYTIQSKDIYKNILILRKWKKFPLFVSIK
jgi:tyrosyl-tRNA synthetase